MEFGTGWHTRYQEFNRKVDEYFESLEGISYDRKLELIDKYKVYHKKKKRVLEKGRTAYNDSMKWKTYRAEFAAEAEWQKSGEKFKTFTDEKEAFKYFKKVVRSKTYQNLCSKNNAAKSVPSFRVRSLGSRTAGHASNWGGVEICAKKGMNEYVLLHELTHMCGNMNHDIRFRMDLIKLCSRFISPKYAKLLKETFKKRKLRVSLGWKNIKNPDQWYKDYKHMEMVRNGKK